MTFFLRNISVSLSILALLLGSVLVYLSGRVVYEGMLNQVFAERVAMVESVSMIVSAHPETILENRSLLNKALQIGAGQNRGTVFFRLVDIDSGVILASAEMQDVGTIASDFSSSRRANETIVRLITASEEEIVEIVRTNATGQAIWMGVDRSFFINPAIVLGVQQAFLLLALFVFIGFLFYFIIKRFLLSPLRDLQESLQEVSGKEGAKEDGASKKRKKESLGELLESFRGTADKIEATLERDVLVSKMKSDFISTTAHQLRTPLSGINWVLESLLSDKEGLKEEQRTLLKRASEKNKEIIEIVGSLLQASSIEQGKYGYHKEEVSLVDEIKKTIEEEKPAVSKSQVTLTFDEPSTPVPKVYVDQERIRWVVRNLVENAIKYTGVGGTVTVSLTQEERALKVAVRDNGIGIAQDQQKHIFEKFFRTETARKKRNEGSGLGLYIAKNIINHHGGKIWFESEEGKGTTFFFTIPVSQEKHLSHI